MAEFTIKSFAGVTFRTTKVSPVDLFALSSQLNMTNMAQSKEVATFALEHLECKISEKWVPVKTKDMDVYMPIGLEENLVAITELITEFINKVVAPAFTKSSE